MAVTDISAMVYDRLAVGKPILVARPASPDAEVDEQGFLGPASWLLAADAGDVLAALDPELNDPSAREKLAFWSTTISATPRPVPRPHVFTPRSSSFIDE